MTKADFLIFFLALFLASHAIGQRVLPVPSEKHLKNIKQLTNGGENAEAYFSFDGKQLIFQ